MCASGPLSPAERTEALERVVNGLATVFCISPEQLRSRTIETPLLSRNVARFVIDGPKTWTRRITSRIF